MGQFCYQVVGRRQGWAYRLGETYSRIFPTQYEATAAAKAAAIKMHEEGDETLVRVRDSTLCWRTELRINGSDGSATHEGMLDQEMSAGR
jgi:hypothetical protein